jgi:Tol biopolymer transport system component/DNA-binding winged helix-turn-helix (wHTH) protein
MHGDPVPLFGDFVLDVGRDCLMQAGRPVHLRPQAYYTLAYLVARAGRLVSKAELATAVWNGRAVTDDSLVQCIGDIRRALGDGEGRRLRTVRGRGYILDIDARPDSPVSPTHRRQDSPSAHRVSRGTLVLASAVAATLALLLFTRAGSVPAPGWGAEAGAFSKLTASDGLELRPSLSPDGKSLLYDGLTPPEFDRVLQVYVKPVDGGPAACLTCKFDGGGRDAVFSPAGDLIAYAMDAREGGIFVMTRDGGMPRRLTARGFRPDWSPDGRHIAYSTRPTDWIPVAPPYSRSELWIVDVASGGSRRVHASDARDPAWAPDGRAIAFWTQADRSANRDVFLVTASDDRTTRITEGSGDNWNPTWAADGRAVYFLSNRGGNIALWRVPVDVRAGAVGPAVVVSLPTSMAAYPRMAATGDLVYADASAERNVHLVSIDAQQAMLTGPPRQVTQGTDFWIMPRLSPLGDRMVMVRAAMFGQEDIFSIGLDGTGLRRLTSDATFDREPDISPDGGRIAFESNRSGLVGIWLMDADGGRQRPLTPPGATTAWAGPRWSPDGRLVAAREQPGHRVVLFDPGRSPAPPVVRLPLPNESLDQSVAMPLSLGRVAWSSDGRQLAGRFGSLLVIYEVRDGTFRSGRIPGAIVGWPPGPYLVLDQWTEQRLAVLDTRTWQTREIPYSPHLRRDDRLILSADGRTLAVERGTYRADIWLMRASARP